MLIDRNSVVVGIQPRLTLAQFTAVLESASSPALIDAEPSYKSIVAAGVDPAFALAIFAVESAFGTVGLAVANKSPGNTRSSITGKGIEVETVKGKFIRYPTWLDGFRDLAARFVAKDYIYARSGLTTIGGILPVFAPASDGNDPAGYINSVIKIMNAWARPGEEVVVGTVLPKITWTPSPNFDPGPTKKNKVIIHDIEGSFDSGNGWIDSSKSGVSAHYIVSADGKRIDQSIKESDIAFHAGNYKYNQESIGVEHEGYQALSKGPYPDVMLRVSAALVAQICKRNGIAPNRQNIIAHGEVPPPNNHTDPGPKWPWDRYMSYVLNEYHGEGNTVPTTFNPNPNNFAVGQGVIEAATRLQFEVLTNEQFYSPNAGQAPGLTQRSMTWAKSEDGKIYRIDAIQDQDAANKPLATWTTQIWLQTA